MCASIVVLYISAGILSMTTKLNGSHLPSSQGSGSCIRIRIRSREERHFGGAANLIRHNCHNKSLPKDNENEDMVSGLRIRGNQERGGNEVEDKRPAAWSRSRSHAKSSRHRPVKCRKAMRRMHAKKSKRIKDFRI